MKLSSLLFEQWNLFPALTLCKLCYHIYHTERMTAAAAGSVGRRPPQQERLSAGSRHQGAKTHLVVLGEGGRRDVLCYPTQIWGRRKRLPNPNSTWVMELRRTLRSAAPQCFSFPIPRVPLGAGGPYPDLCPQKGVRRAGPKCCSLQRCHCSRRWQAKEAATFLSPSHLKSTAASLRHRFVVRDAVLALPAAQEARRKGDFCTKKIFPSDPSLLLCWQGLLFYRYRNCLSCAPFSPACPSLLGMYVARNSD